MRISSYAEALRFARCAGEDAAKRRMRKAGRKVMSQADYDHAVDVMEKMLADLGFDTQRWIATAGLRRNEPDEPPARKRPKRRSNQAPVQLGFAFA